MKLPSSHPASHKGQNGNVLVIGGNEIFYGAPVLAALGVEKSGADLLFLMLPEKHMHVAQNTILNCIMYPFEKEHFCNADIENTSFCSHEPDVLLIGNGLGKHPETLQSVVKFLRQTKISVVIDADALVPEILDIPHTAQWVLTPHEGEFQRLFGCEGSLQNVRKMAQKYGCTLLKKGQIDGIVDPQGVSYENKTGVARMSVGGTGDALAGIVAGFLSQGLSAFEACKSAAYYWGKCGQQIAKYRFSFSAQDMLRVFPFIM
jgi:NAD(P)H-hydrate epimerase